MDCDKEYFFFLQAYMSWNIGFLEGVFVVKIHNLYIDGLGFTENWKAQLYIR